MQGIVKLQNRLAVAMTLSHFLPQRPQPADLSRAAPSVAVSLAEIPEARNAEKVRRSSVVEECLAARLEQAELPTMVIESANSPKAVS